MALLKEWMVTRAVIEQSVTRTRAQLVRRDSRALPFTRSSGPTTRYSTNGSGSTSRKLGSSFHHGDAHRSD